MALNTNALVTLATTKTYMSIISTDTSQDTVLERLINTASQLIENYCSRKLKQITITEYQDGRSSDRILLKEYPVISITSLHMDDLWIFDSTSLIANTDYTVLNDSELVMQTGAYFPKGRGNIKVVYSAGYAIIPSDLEQAALMLIDYMYANANDRRIGVSSKAKNGEQINYKDGIPNFITQMLEPYQRCDFALNQIIGNI